jgi:hypothetical protein
MVREGVPWLHRGSVVKEIILFGRAPVTLAGRVMCIERLEKSKFNNHLGVDLASNGRQFENFSKTS